MPCDVALNPPTLLETKLTPVRRGGSLTCLCRTPRGLGTGEGWAGGRAELQDRWMDEPAALHRHKQS